MNKMHPTHEELIDYLHGELAAPQDAAIHAHLAACSPCNETYQSEVSLTDLLRRQASSEERDLPPSVVRAIHEALARPRQPALSDFIRNGLRPVVLAAMAIAAVLAIGIRFWSGEPQATSINAAYYVNTHAALTASTPFSEDAPIPATLTSDDTAAPVQPTNEPR
jgi:predicted anti-sigma-YlaC factor YlaD